MISVFILLVCENGNDITLPLTTENVQIISLVLDSYFGKWANDIILDKRIILKFLTKYIIILFTSNIRCLIPYKFISGRKRFLFTLIYIVSSRSKILNNFWMKENVEWISELTYDHYPHSLSSHLLLSPEV